MPGCCYDFHGAFLGEPDMARRVISHRTTWRLLRSLLRGRVIRNPGGHKDSGFFLQPPEGLLPTNVVWPTPSRPWHSLLTMRVNIKARIPMHLYQEFHTLPLVLTIET